MAVSPQDPSRDHDVHGTSTVTPTSAPASKKTNWLPWVIGALALLALLFLLSRCGRNDAAVENTTATTTTEATAVEPATPGVTGGTAPAGMAAAGAVGTGNVLEQMQAYLATDEAAGRRFTFDNINFATSSAELPAEAGSTIDGVARVLASSPNARIRVEGYADARGGAGTNAQLGAQRAESVARALIGAGVAANRVETATGGETNPIETNATTEGQADNRRTDIVIIAK
jgi:outer membrane protein OmpA-like peptidoglycan-associated protein